MSGLRLSVRARILSIALIPSFVLLAVGIGASTYLAVEAFQLRDEVSELDAAVAPSIEFGQTVQEERRLSLVLLSGDQSVKESLASARERLDALMKSPELVRVQNTIKEVAPETAGQFDSDTELLEAFGQLRQGIDVGLVPPDQVYQVYNTVMDRFSIGTRGVANALPDPDAVAGASLAVELSEAVEAMSRSNALGVAVVGRMTPDQLREYDRQVGSYHNQLNTIIPALTGQERTRAEALVDGAAWKTLSTVENAIVDHGVQPGDTSFLPVTVAEWQSAATTVNKDLFELYQDHYAKVVDTSIDSAEEQATWWLIAGGAMLLGAVLASMITLRISGKLIRRLKRLRAEALSLADEQLPRIMTRLRNGEDVDVNAEMRSLDFGSDEIGDVADAFNRAESAAVGAAVEEAKTRGGINALFLNIAHRSQVVVHKQLEVLDKAEHGEEDPNRLSVLFELDHLATRARRNAENLIILGGEQPGRQWRQPVPLVELVRSAIAETEDYARVHAGHMAGVSIVGSVVADLIHLIAELVENATSFSPPESRVDVVSNVVGRGAVVEVTDQGLGMSGEQIAQANQILAEPPNFSVANLSSDSRMGLLVVGQIAARNGVSIRLSDSDYGGIRAIVLIPTSLIVASEQPRPVAAGVTASAGFGTGEVNGAPLRHTGPIDAGFPPPTAHSTVSTGSNGLSSVSWPTMEPGETTPPATFGGAPESRATRHAAPEPPAPVAGQGFQPTAGRPALPRRRRQANLAPELTNMPQPQQPQQSAGRHERSSEQVRDLFSAIESGTRQGRMARPEPGTNYHDRREGPQ
ncbi:nitrate- and nitrite sensing domain-containing protein [Actinophytocola sp.]|uniref:sensor histidine kinase n=1 Tax=Actinophytocola sp. TaxID=1872138 RepID=UPI002ED2CFDC